MEVITVIIRKIQVNDSDAFVELSKKIDESDVMLFEPGERNTTPEQQRKSIERILTEKDQFFCS